MTVRGLPDARDAISPRPPDGTGGFSQTAVIRGIVDAAALALLMTALACIHSFDATRGRATPTAADTKSPADAALDIAPRSKRNHDALPADESEPAETASSDVVPAETIAKSKPSAGIIAAFVPFQAELLVTREPSPRDLVTVPTPSSDHVEEKPQPAVLSGRTPQKVEFFTTETRAESVGFVVDCSSSMAGQRFEAVRSELAKSISQLKSDQRFFVVFFNDSVFPMTGDSRQPRLVDADLRHKEQILSFLKNAVASGGTNPEPALQFMARLQPDVIYLLTDGEFQPLQVATYAQFAAAKVAVHTIGFETGREVPVLKEIATRTGGTYRTAGMKQASSSLFAKDPATIHAALADADPAIRREAITVTCVRQLPFTADVIALLADPDDTVRRTVREELRAMAEGTDFGPYDSGDVSAAIARWNRWWVLRTAGKDVLVACLAGGDPDDTWVAASLVRTRRINAADECIAVLRTAASPVWQELRAALRQTCSGQDFGPPDGATAAQVAVAADRWAEWRAAERAKAEAEKAAKRLKLAKEKLRLARDLVRDNPDAVERRCRELIRDFADTPVAAEARELLDEIGGSPEGE